MPVTSKRAYPAAVCVLLLAVLTALPLVADGAVAAGAAKSVTAADDGGKGVSGAGLHLAVQSMQPKVITADEDKLTVAGELTNTGDRRISDIEARVQLADPINGKRQLRSAMRKPPVTSRYRSSFHRVQRSLDPGDSTRFRLSVDLSTSGLNISKPGIYPLTVNVNGRPDYGGDARLTSLNTLLPVRSVPGGHSDEDREAGKSFGMTMVWPIASQPRQLGRTKRGQPILATDKLAHEMAKGGRLDALVNRGGRRIMDDPQLRRATCFAVDPELVQVAAAMRKGYRVRTEHGDKAGKGARVAGKWLESLGKVTAGRCVVPLPYGQADLVALSRAGAQRLEHRALDTDILRTTLPGAKLLEDVVLPDGGMLDKRTMSDLVDHGRTAALVHPRNTVAQPRPTPRTVSGTGSDSDGRDAARVLTTDALLDRGLAGVGTGEGGSHESLTPASTPAVASQNGIATLIYRAQFDQQPRRSSIALPPPRWNTSAEDLTAWLDTVHDLFADHSAYPVALEQSLRTSPSGHTSLQYPPSARAKETPRSLTERVVKDDKEIQRLYGALDKDAASKFSPEDARAELQQGLLRAVSGAWRGDKAAARKAVREATQRLRTFTERVSIGSTNLPISLATKHGQVPVSVRNALPVNVRVRIHLLSSGLHTSKKYTEKTIPANNSRTVMIPVTVQRSGRFNVDMKLTTPDHVPLGKEVRLEVTSSAFGMVTLVITITAFAALVLLAGRRIYRRMRAGRTGGGR